MSSFYLHNQSILPRDVLFQISIDISNFHNVMPEYFNSLEILDDTPNEKLVLESIKFLGQHLDIKTRHVVIYPNIHQVFILSGPLRGTTFSEKYTPSYSGTSINIFVNLKLNGILKFVPFLKFIIVKKMNSIMTEFIACSENYAQSNLSK